MRERDVQVGKVYAVKVSERITPVRLLTLSRWDTYGGRKRWNGRNLRTDRDVLVTAARLRFEVVKAEGCGHWVRADRSIEAHRKMYHARTEDVYGR